MTNFTTEVPAGFEPLIETLGEAFKQAAFGKGFKRHAGNKPFLDQPIFTISREHGVAFLTGQAAKKLGESHVLLNNYGCEHAVQELFGAIVYTAAAVLLLREQYSPEVDDTPQPAIAAPPCYAHTTPTH